MIANRMFPLILIVCVASLFGAEIQERVLICGVCRDVESRLETTIKIMEMTGELFDDYRILVYENNSIDNTPSMLSTWAKKNPKIWIQSESISKDDLTNLIINIHQDGSFFIPEQIARARNIVLKKALSSEYENFPYLIWMDMDFARFPDFDGFIDTFTSDLDWDAVFAYGIDPFNIYWDWYAFRDKSDPIGPELLGTDWWYVPKRFSATQDDPWHPVYSAFGGCGIYKKASIQGCSYSGIATTDLESHFQQLIREGILSRDPQILKYLHLNQELEEIYKIENRCPNLPIISNPKIGIILHDGPDALIWRMNSFVYQYPSVCEHIPFHASMIVRGHDKLYVNPKLIFRYGS